MQKKKKNVAWVIPVYTKHVVFFEKQETYSLKYQKWVNL